MTEVREVSLEGLLMELVKDAIGEGVQKTVDLQKILLKATVNCFVASVIKVVQECKDTPDADGPAIAREYREVFEKTFHEDTEKFLHIAFNLLELENPFDVNANLREELLRQS